MDERQRTEFADDRIWEHFPDTVAATITIDRHALANIAGHLHDAYHGDRDAIDDALFRIGARLAGNEHLCAAIVESDQPEGCLDGEAWLRREITRSTRPRYGLADSPKEGLPTTDTDTAAD